MLATCGRLRRPIIGGIGLDAAHMVNFDSIGNKVKQLLMLRGKRDWPRSSLVAGSDGDDVEQLAE